MRRSTPWMIAVLFAGLGVMSGVAGVVAGEGATEAAGWWLAVVSGVLLIGLLRARTAG